MTGRNEEEETRVNNLIFYNLYVITGSDTTAPYQLNSINGNDVTGGDVCGREETDPIYTWQEIAVLLDYLFLWLFAVNLIIVSTVILSLLYAKY